MLPSELIHKQYSEHGNNENNTVGAGSKLENEQGENMQKSKALIYYIGFNQLNTLFSVGTQKGFHIFSTGTGHKQKTSHIFKKGGIGIVDILFHSNIFALVGGGPDPAFPPNRVMIWEDQRKQCIAQVDCNSAVKAVRLHKNLLVVVLEDQILVYDHNLKEIFKRETAKNPKGIYALSPDSENIVLAFPAVQQGMIRLEHFSIDKHTFIKAHQSPISQIALNRDGTRLATASETGTLIRIFDTVTGEKIKEVRRGTTSAEIFSIAFSNDSKYLCTCSDHGTVHLFSIAQKPDANNAPDATTTTNRTSALSFVSYVYNSEWVNSEWSFAEYRGVSGPAICCFGETNDTIKVITGHGELITLKFDLKNPGTEPVKVSEKIQWSKVDAVYSDE
jgi:hypothetical protein